MSNMLSKKAWRLNGDSVEILYTKPDEPVTIYQKGEIDGNWYITDESDDFIILKKDFDFMLLSLVDPFGREEYYKERGELMKAHNEGIKGVGKDAETVVNEHGAEQTKTFHDFLDIKALTWLELARVSNEGLTKYGRLNYMLIPVEEHLNHAIVHIFAHLAGDTQDEHILHALTRLALAHSTSLKQEVTTNGNDDETQPVQ